MGSSASKETKPNTKTSKDDAQNTASTDPVLPKCTTTNTKTPKDDTHNVGNTEQGNSDTFDDKSNAGDKSDTCSLNSEELKAQYEEILAVAFADEKSEQSDKMSRKTNETLGLVSCRDVLTEIKTDLKRLTEDVLNAPNSKQVSEEGHFPIKTIELITLGGSAAMACQGLPQKWRKPYNTAITHAFEQCKTFQFLCEAFKYYAVHGFKKINESGEDEIDELKWRTFYNSSLTLSVFSDHSDELTFYLAKYPGFLGSVKWILTKDKDDHLNQVQKAEDKEITKHALMLTYTLSKRDANIRLLKNFNFATALEPYLRSDEEKLKLSALVSLASIVDERESEMIIANRDTVKYMLSCLNKSNMSQRRRSAGRTCLDLVFAVRMLARNDANKKMLNELDTVDELCAVLISGDEDEIHESVLALWALAFDPEVRQSMIDNEVNCPVELLYHLRQTSESEKIKKASNGALWTMRDELKVSKKKFYHSLALQLESTKESKSNDKKAEDQDKTDETEKGHIMLSYQWANQKTLIIIRDRLQANGFKVWMDIDEMEGSTIQSMAEAVENARIVLMAMSQKYKDSPNCRAEAEYAYKNKKTIIPLLMERGYSPDGWLGFILGTKLFFDFSGKYEFEDKMVEMFKHVSKSLGKPSDNEDSVKVVKTETKTLREDSAKKQPMQVEQNTIAVSTNYYEKLRTWSQADVNNWINKHGLNTPRLSQLTPGEICLLLTMRQEAPEFFYRSLRKMLHVKDFVTMSKLVSALTEIT